MMTNSVYDYLDRQDNSMLSLLATLVNIDSGSYDKAGIDQIILLLKQQVEMLGLETQLIDLPERGNHLVARKSGSSNLTLLLLGHCDTVFPEGTVAQRKFRIEDGLAYGPGVADMKGGLVVLVFVLDAIKTNRPDIWDKLGLSLVFNSDEEIGSPSSRDIIKNEAKRADATCILEPARPNGEYITKRKGAGTYLLRIAGKSAHAGSQPELGASAIHELCGMVTEILELRDPTMGITINVGVIRGGTLPNVVADIAEAEIDLRILKNEDGERVERALKKIATETKIFGTTASISGGIDFPAMPRTKGAMHLFELVRKAGLELGLDLKHGATGGASDGNYTSLYSPTCDGMGPQGDGIHSPTEYIIVSTLVERAKVLARFIILWLETNENSLS